MSEINTIKTTSQLGLNTNRNVNTRQNTDSDKAPEVSAKATRVDTVSLTDTATQLQALKQTLADAPVVDNDRVSALKAAIAEGVYKERDLQKILTETDQHIARMQVERSGSGEELLNDDQKLEIADLRMMKNKTQQQLREVQGKLRQDIDKLDTQLKFFNIGLVPILVALLALLTGWMRVRKRTKGRHQQ